MGMPEASELDKMGQSCALSLFGMFLLAISLAIGIGYMIGHFIK